MRFSFPYKNVFLCSLFFLSLSFSKAQSLLFPVDYLFDVRAQKTALLDTTIILHTSAQPFLYKELPPDTFKKMKPWTDRFFDKIFYENLIQVRYVDRSAGQPLKFNFDINPILNFSNGSDSYDTTHRGISTNTRGFWLKGQLGNKFFFESAFMENQSYLPAYLKDYSLATSVVPGQGRWKTFKSSGFDYAMSSGVIHFQAAKNFSIRLGHGKQKIGNGYRSLLLSDNSFNYPYLQFTASFFKQRLQYSQTYALLMNLSTGGSKTPPGIEEIFQKKAASFQHLSWHVNKYLDVYAFQGMIWKATDSNNVMHLNPLYANPVIFSNLAAYGFNNTNHIVTGGGFQVRPLKKICIYGQFMYDGVSDSSTANYGYQAGFKLYDALTVKNLFIQYEYNYLSPYSYADMHHPAQSYSHYGQLLTTPALFSQEHIAMIAYNYKRFFVQLKQNYSVGTTHINQYVSYFDGKMGYMINPRYNLNISMGATLRTYVNEAVSTKSQQMQLIYVSLRTSLYNLYYDF